MALEAVSGVISTNKNSPVLSMLSSLVKVEEGPRDACMV